MDNAIIPDVTISPENQMVEKTMQYTHTANALFHFMKERKFLETVLDQKVLYPRYFTEIVDYLNLQRNDGTIIKEYDILGACFCDIPLGSISKPVLVKEQGLSGEKNEEIKYVSHTEFYGKYAIAFSKPWCITNGIGPIQYINKDSVIASNIRQLFANMMKRKDVPNIWANSLLDQLKYIKPLCGKMPREEIVYIEKNFFDEQEWRFVPSKKSCEQWSEKHGESLEPLSENEELRNWKGADGLTYLQRVSNRLVETKDISIGLPFEYCDVKYLVVPDSENKRNLIETIVNYDHLPKEERYDLISKINCLDEISEDY